MWSFADNFNSLKSFSVGEWTLGILAALFAISGVAMFFVRSNQTLHGQRLQKASKWCLFVFVLGVVVVGLIALIGKIDIGLFNTVEKGLFGENSDFDGGWTLWFAPAFFFLIYLFSFGARRKGSKSLKKHKGKSLQRPNFSVFDFDFKRFKEVRMEKITSRFLRKKIS